MPAGVLKLQDGQAGGVGRESQACGDHKKGVGPGGSAGLLLGAATRRCTPAASPADCPLTARCDDRRAALCAAACLHELVAAQHHAQLVGALQHLPAAAAQQQHTARRRLSATSSGESDQGDAATQCPACEHADGNWHASAPNMQLGLCPACMQSPSHTHNGDRPRATSPAPGREWHPCVNNARPNSQRDCFVPQDGCASHARLLGGDLDVARAAPQLDCMHMAARRRAGSFGGC